MKTKVVEQCQACTYSQLNLIISNHNNFELHLRTLLTSTENIIVYSKALRSVEG